jgi:sugar/nucleoside kinase (ribokinase family)
VEDDGSESGAAHPTVGKPHHVRDAALRQLRGDGHACEPFTVRALDTTAAGDAFTGTLGVALALGQDPASAVRHASAAGALAVTQRGASPSLPARDSVLALVGQPITA